MTEQERQRIVAAAGQIDCASRDDDDPAPQCLQDDPRRVERVGLERQPRPPARDAHELLEDHADTKRDGMVIGERAEVLALHGQRPAPLGHR